LVDKLNLNLLFFAPPLYFFGSEFRTDSVLIIWGLPRWTIKPSRARMIRLDERDESISLAKKGFPRANVHHIECSGLSNTHQAITLKVNAPALMDLKP
jgi:hypothetical protein